MILLVAALAGCSPGRFVLVHGAFMGAWVWSPVAGALTRQGAQVTAVDLPAHGDDPTPAGDVTLDAYVDRVASAVETAGGPVHLVGHSMAGMVISQYAERAPEKLESLIYVAAFLPADGRSIFDLLRLDSGSRILPALLENPDGTYGLPREALGPLFCGDCDRSHLAPLLARYRDEPGGPGDTPAQLTPERWGQVPKRYLFATDDVSITYQAQQAMAGAVKLGCSRTLRTAHTPMLSAPGEVATALAALGRCR